MCISPDMNRAVCIPLCMPLCLSDAGTYQECNNQSRLPGHLERAFVRSGNQKTREPHLQSVPFHSCTCTGAAKRITVQRYGSSYLAWQTNMQAPLRRGLSLVESLLAALAAKLDPECCNRESRFCQQIRRTKKFISAYIHRDYFPIALGHPFAIIDTFPCHIEVPADIHTLI